jgi:hypothetical protein
VEPVAERVEHPRHTARPEPGVIRIKPGPAASAAPAVSIADRQQRHNRITIGKVDVQVNNHRPQPVVVPNRAPAGNAQSRLSEAGSLSWFALRP